MRTSAPARVSPLSWVSQAPPGMITALMAALAIGGGGVVGTAAAVKPKLAVALVVAMALALVVLRRMEVGGLALVCLVPILSGVRRGFPVPLFRLTELLTAGTAGVVLFFLRKSKSRPWTRVEWLMAAYTAVGVALGLYDAHQLGAKMSFGSLGTLIGPLQFFLLFRTVRLVLPNDRWRQKALRLLLVSSVPVCTLAILQQANFPKIRTFLYNLTGSDVLTSTGTGSGYYSFGRATGPFPHWTPLAGYLTVVLVVGIALLLDRPARPVSDRVLYGLVLLNGATLGLTEELSAMFGLAVAVVLLGAVYGRLWQVLKVAGATAVILAAATSPFLAARFHQETTKVAGTSTSSWLPQTVQFRLDIWTHQYLPAIWERPLEGWGLVNPPIVVWPATESQYITVLERGGVILMAVYVALQFGLGSAAVSVAKRSTNPLDRATGFAVATLVVILVPMNFVFPYFEDSGMPQALWALVGIMMAGVAGPLPSLGVRRAQLKSEAQSKRPRVAVESAVRPEKRLLPALPPSAAAEPSELLSAGRSGT